MDIFYRHGYTHGGKRVQSIDWQDSMYEETVYIADEESMSYYQCPKKANVAVC